MMYLPFFPDLFQRISTTPSFSYVENFSSEMVYFIELSFFCFVKAEVINTVFHSLWKTFRWEFRCLRATLGVFRRLRTAAEALPQTPFSCKGKLRPLRRSPRALPSTYDLFEKRSIKNFQAVFERCSLICAYRLFTDRRGRRSLQRLV